MSVTKYTPIVIHASDSSPESANIPTAQQLNKQPQPNGSFDFYAQVPHNSPKEITWRIKLASMLVDKLEPERKGDGRTYILMGFPDAYTLYEHVRQPAEGTPQTATTKRQDVYLYGYPNSRKRYRSPAEFFPHLYWLATTGGSDRRWCGCTMCGGNPAAQNAAPSPAPAPSPVPAQSVAPPPAPSPAPAQAKPQQQQPPPPSIPPEPVSQPAPAGRSPMVDLKSSPPPSNAPQRQYQYQQHVPLPQQQPPPQRHQYQPPPQQPPVQYQQYPIEPERNGRVDQTDSPVMHHHYSTAQEPIEMAWSMDDMDSVIHVGGYGTQYEGDAGMSMEDDDEAFLRSLVPNPNNKLP